MDLTPKSNEIVIRIKCDFPERQQKEVCKVTPDDNCLLTVTDLCKRLKCEPFFIYRLTHSRKIPHIKLGNRKLRFDPRQIEEWLASHRIDASDSH